MTRLFGVVILLTSALLLESGGEGRPQVEARTIPITRVVRIPLAVLGSQEVSGNNSTVLAASPGAAEELPEGPNGFDIFEEENILISDPLHNRVVIFDPQGKFRQAWNIGFAADSIRVLPDGNALVREANTGQFHAFNREGKPVTGEMPPSLESTQAHKLTTTSGLVSNPKGSPISVQLNQPGLSLVSLESVGVDNTGNIYIALESSSGESADGINVNKTVRKYAANGSLLSETSKLPLDYYIPPVDEIRVRKGRIYQLMTTSTEVEINIWDTN